MTCWRAAAILCVCARGLFGDGGYRVAGVVLNAATGQPLPGVTVTIRPVDRPEQPLTVIGGEAGTFAFAGLPQGRFVLAGRRAGLLASQWPGTVVTGHGLPTENIVLRLPPPAGISGTVVDDAGDPISGAMVRLFSRQSGDSSQRANDLGEYRFPSLRAGQYYLSVSAEPWYTKFAETFGDAAPANMTHIGYRPRYYPNASEPGAAEALLLKVGQEAVADFTLVPVPAVSVQVHCEEFENLTKHYTLTASGLGGRQIVLREGSEDGSLYNFWGIPVGRYTLRAEVTDGSHTWYGVTEIDAATDTQADVTLLDPPSLSGAVRVDGAGPAPPHLMVTLRGDSGEQRISDVGNGGRFSIPALPPGHYRVNIAGADDYYLAGGEQALELAPGIAARKSLSIARGTGPIAGAVTRAGQPVADALVVLFPLNRAVHSNSDGSYEFRGVPRGEYRVFAVEDSVDLDYADSTALQPYLASATRVLADATGPVPIGLSTLK